MHNHEPSDYNCPFCELLIGEENELNRRHDIVYQDELITATIAPRWWPNNPGHVLIISNNHYENIYDTPDEVVAWAHKKVKAMCVALRDSYPGCTGTSIRQHNEPDGGQDVWHFHIHVFPRYQNDQLYNLPPTTNYLTSDQSKAYADTLRAYYSQHPTN